LEHPDEYKKQLYVYREVSSKCNYFMGKGYDQPPWPKGCRVIKQGLTCNRYEISRDGKHVHSCNLNRKYGKTECEPMEGSKCIEYYTEYNKTKDEERFGETGRLCHFKESLYPHKPWPHGCWIFQGKDPCNTYEISEDHTHVVSCDIPLKKGECIPHIKTPNTCLEYRERPKVKAKEITGAS
jgi:hypothetical protein